ncbi:MAG: ribosome biogenesis protein [Candidatus Heimdallarchaeota archaeon]|nr:ribosome biogenesis protein [Candidatus Heimdallarchaeota archaeon]
MKTLYKCTSCDTYSLSEENCKKCGAKVVHPYPARFSIIKERKYRRLYRKKE